MTKLIEVKSGKTFIGKLKHGADLLAEITHFCTENEIQLGKIQALGAVQKACLAFYNQTTHEYQPYEINQQLEILNLVGNISLKDGKPMVHAHLVLSDEAGKAFGGHLLPGTLIFACEIVIDSFSGAKLEREFDEKTGLPLWEM